MFFLKALKVLLFAIYALNSELRQNESFNAAPLRCVRISKMQGAEDEGDRSLLM